MTKTIKDPIDWTNIDQFLDVSEPGALGRLAKSLGVSVAVLRKRRRKLKLAPVSKGGRPEVYTLTEREAAIQKLREEGKTVRQMADTLEKAPQNIHVALMTIDEKLARQCKLCLGDGVVECGSDGRPRCAVGPHAHVCNKCGGKGYV